MYACMYMPYTLNLKARTILQNGQVVHVKIEKVEQVPIPLLFCFCFV